MINELKKQKITTIIKKYIADLQAIYLFGSYANNTATKNSDIDLAFLADSCYTQEKIWQINTELSLALHTETDLVDLKSVSTVFALQITYYGKRLYYKSDKIATNFEDLTFCKYVRLNDLRQDILKDIKKRKTIY